MAGPSGPWAGSEGPPGAPEERERFVSAPRGFPKLDRAASAAGGGQRRAAGGVEDALRLLEATCGELTRVRRQRTSKEAAHMVNASQLDVHIRKVDRQIARVRAARAREEAVRRQLDQTALADSWVRRSQEEDPGAPPEGAWEEEAEAAAAEEPLEYRPGGEDPLTYGHRESAAIWFEPEAQEWSPHDLPAGPVRSPQFWDLKAHEAQVQAELALWKAQHRLRLRESTERKQRQRATEVRMHQLHRERVRGQRQAKGKAKQATRTDLAELKEIVDMSKDLMAEAKASQRKRPEQQPEIPEMLTLGSMAEVYKAFGTPEKDRLKPKPRKGKGRREYTPGIPRELPATPERAPPEEEGEEKGGTEYVKTPYLFKSGRKKKWEEEQEQEQEEEPPGDASLS